MTLQVLVAAMNQNDHSLLEKMNIRSDAIVGNQCDRDEIEHFEWSGHQISYYSLAERGVGLNRNMALMRASADVVLFADDDVCYKDDYPVIVERAYLQYPDADLIIFNMKESRGGEPYHDIVLNSGKAGRGTVSRFGTFCVSAKTESIRKAGISFSLLFGGGARYGCGEDSIFLQDCLKKGLHAYTWKESIGSVTHNDSTWFSGYTEKYFYDKGALFRNMYPKLCYLLIVYHILKHKNIYCKFGIFNAVHTAIKGISDYS